MPVSPSSQNPQNPQISGRKRKDVSPDKATAGTEKQNTMKGADFGKAIGINKPANVRDKIQKWQQELEGDESGSEKPVSPAPDNDSGTPVSSPKLQPTPKTKELEENMALKTVNITPGPKKAQPIHNKLDQDVQLATAPKKRVVSDSHWRNKKSPPKDPTTRPSPKPLPNAWVRPAVRKQDSSGKQDNAETKPPTTSPPIPRPLLIYTSKSTGQRTRSQRKRRPSRPTSSGNDERPKSSGSGSGKGAKSGDDVVTSPLSPPLEKEKEKTELVRVRRRRRAQTSPRGSLSAEDVTPVRQKSIQRTETALSEDPANIITLEYESNKSEPRRDEDIRERRRKRRPRTRSEGSQDASLERTSAGRRPSNRKAYQKLDGEEAAVRPAEPGVFETPPKVFGSRLEAWLDGTPDPFVDGDSHRRRKPSKESISTLQLSAQQEKSDCSGSAEALDESVEDKPKRANSGRRRRRQRSSATKISTQDEDEAPSTTISDDITATTLLDQGREVTSSPTLKRRGARRAQSSPTKDRSMSLSPTNESLPKEVDATSSAPSSFVDASTMELGKVTLRPPPDNYAMRRMFPSTGKRLSTIASVETFATKNHAAAPSEAVGSEVVETVFELNKSIGQALAPEVGSQLVAETSTIVSRKSTRRNRLASHADLISVLSMPKAGTRSIVSARSIRTNRSRLATATIDDIMKELQSDEIKYMRELRTLVDGVIPVLLSCVLSKSDSALAIGLFSPSAKTDPNNVTKPIVDMGVSLERLKTLHKRVPKEDSEAFLSWTQSAQRIYSDYINAWRLGFQDVVVSLAPADEDPFTPAKVVNGPEDAAPWDEGLPRNAEGYVVNGDGERVDVAYMLKRPLVRLKYLTKSIKGINHVKPSERAEKMANIFQELVTAARKRSNDEHARLEDEAASNIDPTRARDPRSLAPLAGVRIDPARCVRARDHFDMHLYHSSGQEVNCRIEMLLRDDATGTSKGGDVLICEVDNTGRWLLLPPIQQGRISARNGDLKGEIIVMIRGYHAGGSEWQEVMSLTIDDEQAGFEWVHMLGLNPIPPQLSELKRDQHAPADGIRPNSSHASSSLVSTATGSTLPQTSRTPSPHEVEIPIGEQANETSKQWGYDTPDRRRQSRTASPITPPSGDSSLVGREADRSPISTPSPIELRRRVERADHTPTARTTTQPEDDPERTPRSLNDAVALAGTGSPNNLKRTKAKRLSKNLSPSPTASRPSRQITLDDPIELPKDHAHLDRPNRAVEARLPRSSSKRRRSEIPKPTPSAVSQSSSKGFSVWMPSASDVDNSDDSDEDELSIRSDDEPSSPSRPQTHRRVSSVPTIDLPTIPRLRKTSQPTTPIKKYEPETVLEAPVSAPPKLQEQPSKPVDEDDDKPPPVPPHRSPSPATPLTLKASNTPVFVPTLPAFKNKRRSSSPLKHEYEPSTCTESSSESEEEVSEEEDALSTSESSEDELEDDIPTPLMPISQMKQPPRVSPPASIYTLPNDTITPSQSASNTPYRTVPQGSGQASKAVASIFSWSDVGRWDSLHPEECSIVITPGKIEVFEITAAHSKPFITDGDEIIQPEARTPLIAVELTPLVPLRKSTAIDISIRSPPTADSRIRSGNNIMLRSRNPTECAQLYAMINHSRINNPTYIALQNARGPYGQTSWAEAMDRQNAARQNTSSGGWLAGTLGRRSSYRKTTTRAASISAATESSVGTMNTALRSALGRFSFAKNSRFSIRNSTLGSRSTNSFDTGSSGSGSGNSTPNGMLDPTRAVGAPAGITNTKCRLYERDSLTKWRDMGSARLTIMLPTTPSPSSPNRLQRAPGSRDYSQEKRILVTGKSKGEVLLDVTLSESCFERVARSGIAVSVWEDIVGDDGEVGRVAKTGGVSGARARIFMIQMKSERECAYCFSLLGKLRY